MFHIQLTHIIIFTNCEVAIYIVRWETSYRCSYIIPCITIDIAPFLVFSSSQCTILCSSTSRNTKYKCTGNSLNNIIYQHCICLKLLYNMRYASFLWQTKEQFINKKQFIPRLTCTTETIIRTIIQWTLPNGLFS